MGSFARRITIAASIAGALAVSIAELISAAPATAMAQFVVQTAPFGNSTDYRPD